MSTNPALTILLALCTSFSLGCGGGGDHPTLGGVKGTVTMNGKPLGGVMIVVNPTNGRAGSAIVGADGKYELLYKSGIKGTALGPNKVTFAWPTGVSGPTIPEKYSTKSELKIDVKKGSNTFDFALESTADESAAGQPQPSSAIID